MLVGPHGSEVCEGHRAVQPITSGTGYTILATLVTLYGEDGAFAYLRKLGPNVVRYTQSGTAQGPSVARGEVALGVTFVHEFVTQQLAGFTVDVAIPCEGTGRRAGRHGDHQWRAASGGSARLPTTGRSRAARRSSPTARRTSSSRPNASATIRPEAARFAQAKTLDVDPLKFGQPRSASGLLERWQKRSVSERVRADRALLPAARGTTRPCDWGIGDDAAVVAPTPGCELAISVDMLVEGRHFLADVDPRRSDTRRSR
jgi:hypothetical protein